MKALNTQFPDGIVTVHLAGKRYRGAYFFREDKLIVTAYGLTDSSADLSILGGERGRPAVKLAKLMLVEMVRQAGSASDDQRTLALTGSTTHRLL